MADTEATAGQDVDIDKIWNEVAREVEEEDRARRGERLGLPPVQARRADPEPSEPSEPSEPFEPEPKPEAEPQQEAPAPASAQPAKETAGGAAAGAGRSQAEVPAEELERLRQIERTFKGRQRAAQKELDQLRAQLEQLKAQQERQPDETHVAKLNEAQEQYPEIVAPLRQEINDLKEQIRQLLQGHVSLAQGHITDNLVRNTELVLAEHPDLPEITAQPEFLEWVENGPRYIQEAYNRNAKQIVDAREAIELLRMYKADAGLVPRRNGADRKPAAAPAQSAALAARRHQQVEGLVTPRSRKQPLPEPDGPGEDASYEELWRYYARQVEDEYERSRNAMRR
jgi:uncharacterized protein YukE